MPVREWTERYFGEITHLDAAIGRLLAEVETLGLRDDTVVVFTSDHGDMGGCRGRFEKGVPYEEATWIPVMVRLPGQTTGRDTDALFSSVDFLPTLLTLCGLPPPETAEGVDYVPLIRSRTNAPRREHLMMQLGNWACIRRGDVKVILDAEGNTPRELYRLDADPFEQNNMVDHAGEQGAIAELRNAYSNWLADVRTRSGDPERASMRSPALREADVNPGE
jgi:arylsulfatase A-like enzyme